MRQVMPLAIVADETRGSISSTYLQARCSIAKAPRTFRLDRIESLSNAATGETFTVADWVSSLHLGDGKPFTWADDAGQDDFGADGRAPAINTKRIWRGVLLALLVGYAIGRLRLIRLLFHYLHVKHGLWF